MTATDLRSSVVVDDVRLVTFVELDERSREVVRCWRNAAPVRRWMYTDHEIGHDEHRRFLESLREDDQQFWWLMQVDAFDVAVMNFQHYDKHQRTVSPRPNGTASEQRGLLGRGRQRPRRGALVRSRGHPPVGAR